MFASVVKGSVDLAAIRDPVQRHMYEIQILEFGQIPRQLFPAGHPHPPRFAGLVPPTAMQLPVLLPASDESRRNRSWSWSAQELQLDQAAALVFEGVHKKPVTDLAVISDDQLLSVSLDGLLKVHRLSDGHQILSVRPVEAGSPLTACLCLPGLPASSSVVVLGTLQNELAIFQVDCCRLDVVAVAHDDCITAFGKFFF